MFKMNLNNLEIEKKHGGLIKCYEHYEFKSYKLNKLGNLSFYELHT